MLHPLPRAWGAMLDVIRLAKSCLTILHLVAFLPCEPPLYDTEYPGTGVQNTGVFFTKKTEKLENRKKRAKA